MVEGGAGGASDDCFDDAQPGGFGGVPFNIASYSLLTHMLAQQAGLHVGEFIWTGGDCHIYDNHREQVALQLTRDPRSYP